jgi:hypothetical protein
MAAALVASGIFTLLVRVRPSHPQGAFPVIPMEAGKSS